MLFRILCFIKLPRGHLFYLVEVDVAIVEEADLKPLKWLVEFIQFLDISKIISYLEHCGNGMRTIPLPREFAMTEAHFCNILNGEGSHVGMIIVHNTSKDISIFL